jgi:hypothetical protein
MTLVLVDLFALLVLYMAVQEKPPKWWKRLGWPD